MQWSKQAYFSQNNIEPANTRSISFNSPPACLRPTTLPSPGISKFFLGIYWTQRYVWEGSTVIIYYFKVLQFSPQRTWENYLVASSKVVAILNSFIGMPRCDAMKTIKHKERCGVGNRIECMFVFTVCLWALMHGIEIAWFCIHLCFCVYVLLWTCFYIFSKNLYILN